MHVFLSGDKAPQEEPALVEELERITRRKLELLQVRQTSLSVSVSEGVPRP